MVWKIYSLYYKSWHVKNLLLNFRASFSPVWKEIIFHLDVKKKMRGTWLRVRFCLAGLVEEEFKENNREDHKHLRGTLQGHWCYRTLMPMVVRGIWATERRHTHTGPHTFQHGRGKWVPLSYQEVYGREAWDTEKGPEIRMRKTFKCMESCDWASDASLWWLGD